MPASREPFHMLSHLPASAYVGQRKVSTTNPQTATMVNCKTGRIWADKKRSNFLDPQGPEKRSLHKIILHTMDCLCFPEC